MQIKWKIIFMYPFIAVKNRKARKISKKLSRSYGEEKYPLQWRNDWVIKRADKFLKLLKIDLVVTGFENIPKQSSIITPNHSSSLDPAVLLSAFRNPDPSSHGENKRIIFISKKELKNDKKFSGYADMLNTFYIDRSNPRQSLKEINNAVIEAKSSRRHLLIFPEGTRSDDGTVKEFKTGAFKFAKKSYLPIVPVTILNSFGSTNINRKKHQRVEVIFHKALKPSSFIHSENKGIALKVEKIVKKSWKKPEHIALNKKKDFVK